MFVSQGERFHKVRDEGLANKEYESHCTEEEEMSRLPTGGILVENGHGSS